MIKKKILKFDSTMRREKKICERKKTFEKKMHSKIQIQRKHNTSKKSFFKKKIQIFY